VQYISGWTNHWFIIIGGLYNLSQGELVMDLPSIDIIYMDKLSIAYAGFLMSSIWKFKTICLYENH